VAAELRAPGDPALLLPAEAACLGRAVKKRVEEFAAGRLCARRALAEFGIEDFALRVRSDRQPQWPATLVGSITHTQGLCAAVAAERRRFAGVGLDSEVVGHVKRDIWEKICVEREIDWLASLPGAGQSLAAALIFAAKEAFYKCQYPVTGEFLSFHDVEVDATKWGPERAEFSVRSTRPLAIDAFAAWPVTGRYRFHEGYVSAGVALRAAQ
jgi:4'-phosphopantetheinyl transferase EntD